MCHACIKFAKHDLCFACCIKACSHANDLRMAVCVCLLHAVHVKDHQELQ